MSKHQKKSICILVDSLTSGGAEKVASLLSKSFYSHEYNVSVISMIDAIDYDYKGELYIIGITPEQYDGVLPIRMLFRIRRIYKKINADIYIDFRARYNTINELLLHLFVYDLKKTIFTIHSQDVYKYLPQKPYVFRLYNKAKAIVAVSEGVLEETKKSFTFTNLVCIPNFYDQSIIDRSFEKIDLADQSFIIAVGRLRNEIKQFDKLILAYAETKAAQHNLPLIILGEGLDYDKLNGLIRESNLENKVKLLGFKENPYSYIKSSKYLVLSSSREGFPMVLVEALAVDTPVIAFNCKSGPSEIVKDRENGLLVKNQDFNALKEAMDTMFTDSKLYLKCKENSKVSISKYSETLIFKRWLKLIKG